MKPKKPKEYLLNKAVFCNQEFYIDERAYIPNPETEQLVEIVVGALQNPSTIVDVGTGNGCIAICLAKRFESARVYAIDIDPGALAVARRNIESHGVKNVSCIQSNYVDDLKINSPDIIVANLPWGDEDHLLKSNSPNKLAFEPAVAVFHPKGALGAYEELIASILRKGWNTTLYFESGVVPKEKVKEIIPTNLSWQYIAMKDYSVSKIIFR